MPYADEQNRKLYQHLYYLKTKQNKSIQSKKSTLKPTIPNRTYKNVKDISKYLGNYSNDPDDGDQLNNISKYEYYQNPNEYINNPFLIRAQMDQPTFSKYISNDTPRYIRKMPYDKLVQMITEVSNKLEQYYEKDIDKVLDLSTRLFGEIKSREKTEYIYVELLRLMDILRL